MRIVAVLNPLLGAVIVPRSSERAFSVVVSLAGFATSAVRDAVNSDDVLEAVRAANSENPHRKIYDGPPAVRISGPSAHRSSSSIMRAMSDRKSRNRPMRADASAPEEQERRIFERDQLALAADHLRHAAAGDQHRRHHARPGLRVRRREAVRLGVGAQQEGSRIQRRTRGARTLGRRPAGFAARG